MYYIHARNCVERKVYGNSALSAQRVSKSKIIEQSFYKRKCTNDKIANEKAVNVSLKCKLEQPFYMYQNGSTRADRQYSMLARMCNI